VSAGRSGLRSAEIAEFEKPNNKISRAARQFTKFGKDLTIIITNTSGEMRPVAHVAAMVDARVIPADVVAYDDEDIRLAATFADAGGGDIFVDEGLELVVRRHLMALAAFFVEPDPPALALGVVVLDAHGDDGADAGEGVGHDADERAVAQPDDVGNFCLRAVGQGYRLDDFDAAEQQASLILGQHRRLAALDDVLWPAHRVRRVGGVADLVIIGSHCVGLDVLIGRLQAEGILVKSLNVGSTGGLAATKRGECDIAAIHLMDPETGEYNRPFLTPSLELVAGYRRLQGIVYRNGDPRFEGRSLEDAIAGAIAASDCLMVNRNAGSGTRILTDRLLGGTKPPGYWSQPKSHNAVAVAVAQNRADWGIAIEIVAQQYRLGFIPAQDEHYDFIVPKARLDRPAVQRFRAVLADPVTRDALTALHFKL
jgi:molybdate-binding protein